MTDPALMRGEGWVRCRTCNGRGTVMLYSGVIVHGNYGELKVEREPNIYRDFPPGAQFIGGSWTASCPECRP